jgi:hypothetical protein
MTLAAGTKLGRYEIRSKLGAGGMGEVYLIEAPGFSPSPAPQDCLTRLRV